MEGVINMGKVWFSCPKRFPHHAQVYSKCNFLGITMNAAKASATRGSGAIAKWRKPEPRQLKLNVDASFHVDSMAGSVGALIRDYKGTFVAAFTKFLPHVSYSTMGESMAMQAGLALANSL